MSEQALQYSFDDIKDCELLLEHDKRNLETIKDLEILNDDSEFSKLLTDIDIVSESTDKLLDIMFSISCISNEDLTDMQNEMKKSIVNELKYRTKIGKL